MNSETVPWNTSVCTCVCVFWRTSESLKLVLVRAEKLHTLLGCGWARVWTPWLGRFWPVQGFHTLSLSHAHICISMQKCIHTQDTPECRHTWMSTFKYMLHAVNARHTTEHLHLNVLQTHTNSTKTQHMHAQTIIFFFIQPDMNCNKELTDCLCGATQSVRNALRDKTEKL